MLQRLTEATVGVSLLEDRWTQAVRGLDGVLHDGHKWSVAREEFRKSRLVVLYNAHFLGENHSIQAEFYGGRLDGKRPVNHVLER